jgi:tryptophan-rich sensory protein
MNWLPPRARYMPAWMIIAAVITGIVGILIMMVASSDKKAAKIANDYAIALSGGRFNESGLVVVAVRR